MILQNIVLVLLCVLVTNASAVDELIGTLAPELHASPWINSDPITLNELRSHVVLIRWWTAPDCPFCKASSAALNEWHKKFSKQGLQVLGIYHHKNSSPLTPELVKDYAQKFGFTFPIGIDNNWDALRAWWMYKRRDWTSVSFLLDKEGVIQYIHPGGDYVKGDKDYQEIEDKLNSLL